MIGYVSLEETKEFLNNRFDISEITDIELKRNLYLALDKIENISIRDSGRNENQSLNFPRIGEKETPLQIKQAQMLEAYSMAINTLNADTTTQDLENGIAGRSIGDMSISYNTATTRDLKQFSNLESARIMKMFERKTYGYTS